MGCHAARLHEISPDILYVYLQNEEVLKKCAQDYLSRIKQEEQRYQTLKVHAEEKLDKWVSCFSVCNSGFQELILSFFNPGIQFQSQSRTCNLSFVLHSTSNRANEDIAQVRAKANAEGVALNASLRKEQMKVESLERAVIQKVGWQEKENEGWKRNEPSYYIDFQLNIQFMNTVCLSVSHRIKRLRNSPRSAMNLLPNWEQNKKPLMKHTRAPSSSNYSPLSRQHTVWWKWSHLICLLILILHLHICSPRTAKLKHIIMRETWDSRRSTKLTWGVFELFLKDCDDVPAKTYWSFVQSWDSLLG